MIKQAAPDARWRDVMTCVAIGKPPKGSVTKRAYDVIKGIVRDEVMEEAIAILYNERSRDIMVGFLLSGATCLEIEASLQVRSEVTMIVQELYADLKVLRNKLEKFEYVNNYIDNVACAGGRAYIRVGLSGGPDQMHEMCRMGSEPLGNFDPAGMMQRMIVTAASHSYALRFSSTPEAQDRMIKHMKNTHGMLAGYDRVNRDAPASAEALAALTQKRTSTPITSFGVPKDELVH